MTDTLKNKIQEDMKIAMRAKNTQRLGAIRLLIAAIKQKEIDDHITVDNNAIFTIINKMVKQRRDSIEHYQKAKRQDLVDQEAFEIDLLHAYLPKQLSEDEVQALIQAAIKSTSASSIKDIGKVMAELKPKLQGRADMGVVSVKIKQWLTT